MSPRLKQIGFAIFTFAVYASFLNWKIASLLVVAIAFHECSHLWAAQYLGLKTRGFYLVPFMGGVAIIEGRYRSYVQQAFVAIMGPVGGGLLAGITAGAYFITHIEWLGQAAQWMSWLNLINLLPLSFLDGGQIMGTVTYSINKTLGMVCLIISTILAVIVLFRFNAVLSGMVIVFGGMQVVREIKNWKNYRADKWFLVDEDYLQRPKSLTKMQMVLTITSYTMVSVALWTLCRYLPEEGITYFLSK